MHACGSFQSKSSLPVPGTELFSVSAPRMATGEASASGMPPGGPHFLESEWVIWEHRSPDKNSKSYEDNMEKLCEMATNGNLEQNDRLVEEALRKAYPELGCA